MNASGEIVGLLRQILAQEVGRTELARWLARRSLGILESSNGIDRAVVVELDVALGEMQRGRLGGCGLVETAKRLIAELGLDLRTIEEEVWSGGGLRGRLVTTWTGANVRITDVRIAGSA